MVVKREELLNLIRQGYNKKQIAQIIQTSVYIIENTLKRIDLKLIEEAEQEAKRKEQQEILDLIEKGYSQIKIAQIKGVSKATITNRIQEIDEYLVEEARQKAKEEEQQEILNLIRQDYSREEIALLRGVSIGTINNRILEIDKQLVKNAKTEASRIRQEDRTNNGRKMQFQHIIMIVKSQIDNQELDNAIKYLNIVIDSSEIDKVDRNRLILMKEKVEDIKQQKEIRSKERKHCEIEQEI